VPESCIRSITPVVPVRNDPSFLFLSGGNADMAKKKASRKSKPKPSDPSKWSAAKAKARRKFDVYPSAYANGWAVQEYKRMGGRWK